MVMETVPTLEILVAGDAGSAKTNFIDRFLYHYPSSAEVRRKNGTMYFSYKVGGELKIHLYDVSDRENIDRDYCKDMNVIFFCYAANDPESLQSLEKWCRLLKDEADEKGIQSSPLETKKQYSFLVADMSNLGGERNVSNRLSAEANTMKEIYGINRLLECSFQEEEMFFRTILTEVLPPESVGKSTFPEDEFLKASMTDSSDEFEDISMLSEEEELSSISFRTRLNKVPSLEWLKFTDSEDEIIEAVSKMSLTEESGSELLRKFEEEELSIYLEKFRKIVSKTPLSVNKSTDKGLKHGHTLLDLLPLELRN